MFAERSARWLLRTVAARYAALRRTVLTRRTFRLPATPEPVAFADVEHPVVSVIIPAFNRWRYTNSCLKALAAADDPSIATEIVVVDDASTDRTAELLAACRGVRVVRLERNGGFGPACNAGAASARGTYLHFLNNDALVTDGWETPLVERFAQDARVAAAVSQLRDPAGRISEAGGIIWSDGQGWNYGRGDSARDWRYRSPREVDYGSAASLMVDAGAFRRAGGFDPAFQPAYYEDVDLCFRLRAAGGRIVYEPRSIVSHAEGATYGSNARVTAREAQERSREIFALRWADTLREHRAPDVRNVEAASRRLTRATILVVDEHVPFSDRDAGSRRIAFLVELLRERGWRVVFGALDAGEYEPYATMLRSAGADVVTGFGAQTVTAMKRENVRLDAAWLSRPEPAARVMAALREAFGLPIVFDTVDLHYRRLEREAAVGGHDTKSHAMRAREMALAREADVTVTGGGSECALLRAEGIVRAFEFPVIEPLAPVPTSGWESRTGIIFLGNYAHAPNVDAARWLCDAIMPIVRRRLPGVELTLAGADPTRSVRALAQQHVRVTGFVADAGALLAQARVFAVPLRFGAGTKGKTVYALAHGIPVVATPVGAEDVFTAAEYNDTAEDPEKFAARVVELHEDRERWERLSQAGRAIAARFTPDAAGRKLDAVLAALGFER